MCLKKLIKEKEYKECSFDLIKTFSNYTVIL